jgi:hypothetical protein
MRRAEGMAVSIALFWVAAIDWIQHCDWDWRSFLSAQSCLRATISNENFSSSFTLSAPPATEMGLMP